MICNFCTEEIPGTPFKDETGVYHSKCADLMKLVKENSEKVKRICKREKYRVTDINQV